MPNRTTRVLYVDDDPGLARLVHKTVAGAAMTSSMSRRPRRGSPASPPAVSTSSRSITTCRPAPGSTSWPAWRTCPTPPVVYVTGSAEPPSPSPRSRRAPPTTSPRPSARISRAAGSAIDQALERVA